MSYGLEDDKVLEDQVSIYEEELSILILELEEVANKVYDKANNQDLVDFRLPVEKTTEELIGIVNKLKDMA